MDVPGIDHLLLISDAAINMPPRWKPRSISSRTRSTSPWRSAWQPRVGVLSAVETVTPKIPSTFDAAVLSKMAERGQIKGGIVDGPLAMDNAIDMEAAKTKGIASLWPGAPSADRAER